MPAACRTVSPRRAKIRSGYAAAATALPPQVPHDPVSLHASMVSLADILTVVSAFLDLGFTYLSAEKFGQGSEVGMALWFSWFASEVIALYVRKHAKPGRDPWNLQAPWMMLDAAIKVLNVAIALVLAGDGSSKFGGLPMNVSRARGGEGWCGGPAVRPARRNQA